MSPADSTTPPGRLSLAARTASPLHDATPSRDTGAQVRDFARLLREQWWVILLCVVATTSAAVLYTASTDKTYEASAKLLLPTDNLSSSLAGAGIGGVDVTRQAATDAQLVGLPAVAARVSRRHNRALSTAAVRTSAAPDTNLLTVTVTDHDPAAAAFFANAFAAEYVRFRRGTTLGRYANALEVLRARLSRAPKGSPDAATLRGQVKQLELLASLRTGDPQLVQAAVKPAVAVSPRPARNLALALILGTLLAIALASLRDRLDRRIKSEAQLEHIFPGVPLIGLVPRPGGSDAHKMMAAESFYSLGTGLRYLERGRELNTLLVTSAVPGEGKTTVTLNLALALREHGRSVLAVDADLRRPALSDRLKADREQGVSSVLAGESTIATSVQERTVEPSANGAGPAVALSGSIAVVGAGPVASRPQLLLDDSSLRNLLDGTRSQAQTIIFDGPPLGAFSDMLPLAKEVDGVIIAARLSHSRTDQLERFASQLSNASIKPIGIVVLGVRIDSPSYYAEYLREQ